MLKHFFEQKNIYPVIIPGFWGSLAPALGGKCILGPLAPPIPHGSKSLDVIQRCETLNFETQAVKP